LVHLITAPFVRIPKKTPDLHASHIVHVEPDVDRCLRVLRELLDRIA
jgi:hypothetical protein